MKPGTVVSMDHLIEPRRRHRRHCGHRRALVDRQLSARQAIAEFDDWIDEVVPPTPADVADPVEAALEHIVDGDRHVWLAKLGVPFYGVALGPEDLRSLHVTRG